MVADDDNGAKARDFNLEIVFLPLIPTPPPRFLFFVLSACSVFGLGRRGQST